MKNYADILEADRPVTLGRTPMTRADRAAQFSPFAALTGYEAAVQETARYTDLQIELDENARELLDSRLRQLHRGDPVTVTWFRPDDRKSGGAYVTVTGRFLRVDPLEQTLLLEGQTIPLARLVQVE